MRIDDSGSVSAAATAHAALADETPQVALAARRDTSAAVSDSEGPSRTLALMAKDGTAARFERTMPAAPPQPALPPVDGYQVGPPQRPAFHWDEGFAYNTASATPGDYLAAAEWQAKLTGAQLLRPDLADATAAYAHYWDNNGTPLEVNYAKAYREDSAVRTNVDSEIARTAAAVDRMAAGGATSFSVTGPAHAASNYPTTENWQKTIGAYQQWSSADVTVNGNQVSMTITVHAEDHYNFNRGQADIASGAPDNANGRFTELGWAKPFDTHGEITRTVTWTLGSPPSAAVVAQQAPDR
jgi:hypothetical protein